MPGMEGFINFNGTLEGSIAGGAGGNVTDVKVRDSQETEFESVVNEQGVAEIDLVSYVRRNELTQAIENIENSIDNVVELVDTKQNIINYSNEEQLTGQKWIDGRNIYQKTVVSSFAYNSLTLDIQLHSDNIFIINREAFLIASDIERYIIIPPNQNLTTTYVNFIEGYNGTGTGMRIIRQDGSNFGYTPSVVTTIKYLKSEE